MSTEGDRRADGMSRVPFEALVEVGGAMGPSFEAQAVNVSEEGMLLRTAYLPEEGQALTCRFDTEGGGSVLASGEVVWTQNAGKGGEFGIRFTDLDGESIDALRKMCGVTTDGEVAPTAAVAGSKVRLHIEGLASPMRARVKGSEKSNVTVGSDLGFLQVGKELALEDAESGAKRPAKIDRVDVVVDPTSHIPQLVVTLRYADEAGVAASAAEIHVDEDVPQSPPETRGDLEQIEKATNEMKGTIARGVAAIGPTFAKMSKRAKTTIALIAAKRHAAQAEERDAPRRTTAAPPGGGLHTAGRRVVRGGSDPRIDEVEPKFKITKRKAMVAGGAVVATLVAVVALRHPSPSSESASASTTDTTTDPNALLEAKHLPPIALPPTSPVTTPVAMGGATSMPSTMDADPDTMGDDPSDDGAPSKKKHGKVASFGNGPVSHGNVLRLKMDGAITQLQGAAQPTGFTVKVPGRKPLEAAGPLASRDGRIAALKVTNDAAGAELTLSFKDGVPNYQVRAKGDILEIDLAPIGKAHGEGAIAKKGEHGKHHSKKHHEKTGDSKSDKTDKN
jgi:hypothetical protein